MEKDFAEEVMDEWVLKDELLFIRKRKKVFWAEG